MAKFIQTSEHAIIGESGAAAATLAPGERVPFNEEADSHKEIERGIEAGDEACAHLSIVEVDPKDEKKQEEELAKQLEKAEKVVAKEQAKEDKAQAKEEAKVAKAQENAPPQQVDANPPPQDVEAKKLAEDDQPPKTTRTRKARG